MENTATSRKGPTNFDVIDIVRRERLALLKLTDKERIFCERYVEHFDGITAMREAGYEEADPRMDKKARGGYQRMRTESHLNRLLEKPHIREYLILLKESVASRVNVSVDSMIAKLKAMAFAKMTDYIKWNKDGLKWIVDSESLTEAQAAGVMEVTETEDMRGRKTVKVKLFNQLTAVELLYNTLERLQAREKEAPKAVNIDKRQLLVFIQSPVGRRALEVLAEGLFDQRVLLTGGKDNNQAAFDEIISKNLADFEVVTHGKKSGTGAKAKLVGEAATGKGGAGESGVGDSQGFQDADESGHERANQGPGESGATVGNEGLPELDESSRYDDIDGL